MADALRHTALKKIELHGILIYRISTSEARQAVNSFLEDTGKEMEALQTVIASLKDFDPEARARIFASAATFLQIGIDKGHSMSSRSIIDPGDNAPSRYPAFSADLASSPKEFVLQKHPRTDVERVAVLAYYLTHFRDTPHFKTLDISKLNTEAAQPKFSNAANSVNNAAKMRYLVGSMKGMRQISAAGEQFVEGLPDRDAARAAMVAAAPRRSSKKKSSPRKTASQSPIES
jgi:predicted Fe-Mo cluster-binding NifX family protein